jgi:transcriptional regulator with XRE-family HTH domain
MIEREKGHAPGEEIRRLREARGLRPVDVQRISNLVTRGKNCADFGITEVTLAEIENEQSLPNVRQLFSLAACFEVPLKSILALYGVDPAEIHAYHDAARDVETQIATVGRSFVLPFDNGFDVRHSAPITGDVLQWAGLPDVLRSRLDPARYKYAWIGAQDDAMAELVPAGSLVEIDRNQTKIEVGSWPALRDRPIYFCWTTEGYRCAWCELADDQLLLIPHPLSHTPVRVYRTPREAAIIGRVTFGWVPFGGSAKH